MAVKATATITLSTVVDVAAVYRYYLLQSSTLNPPSKPTVKPPTGSWTDTEPTYTSGSTNTLYFVDLTVFSDGTWSYSSVSRSSAYEAAKEAYNRAMAAQTTASNAQNDIDNLEIGGRNLLMPTKNEISFSSATTSALNLTDYAKTLTVDDPLYLSFEAKASVELYLDWYFNDGATSYSATTTSDAFSLTTEYVRYSCVITPHNDLAAMVSLRARQSGTAHGGAASVGTVYLRNVMLERGTKASTWTPAPEEVASEINAVQSIAEQALSQTELIVGTQTASTGAWTGVASFSALVDGQQIAYWLPYAGSGNATLNLTLANGSTTGAINCYYSGTTRLTTHYAAGNIIHLTYRKNAVISGSSTTYTGWWADANYDTNTYDRIRMNNAITAKSAITSGWLIVGDNSGFYRLQAGIAFIIKRPILYAASAIDAAATGTNNYLSYPSINIRTAITNSSWAATKNKTLYIVGTLSGTVFTVKSSDWLTTEPADDTGTLSFISLGHMYSTYQMYLYPEHPVYRMVNGVLTAASQIAYEAQEAVVELGSNVELQLENVHAQITETADAIRSEVQANYASASGVNQLRQQVTTLAEQTESNFTWTTTKITEMASDMTAAQEATAEQLALIQTYMSFGQNGLTIGKTGNPFTFRVVNDRLAFYMNDTEVAYLSNNKLYVTQAEVLNRMQIGKFAFEPQSNGNMSIIFTG